MEYACKGDLNNLIESQKISKKGVFFSEDCVLDWITQISLGIYYLHEKNIIHCDIKLENLFITYYNDVKIGDFGIGFLLEIYIIFKFI